MTSIDAFFDRLRRDGADDRLVRVSGSVRFDIRGERGLRHWRLDIDRGRLRVTEDDGPASAVIRMSEQTAEALVAGEMNGLAAINRGEIMVDGDLALALRLGRLLPAPAANGRHGGGGA
ncbi:SCP-2 sterol transfer family protein [Micromonospora sediminicola]|uniref:SCP-2 sterol transfer family protein n=1 Tax=Micromonospora sediminicola TaxID=946078 RepID=A0A1A9BCL8_9ACTN|nr:MULTISPECIES: SCP2 sterol-binding domain-containing protein [Micromonospora]PGH45355.1 sterol-binding protein [Micromonospora sp. WMMA1996]SBT67250.1 SCP-2 sterol transfer family protein [Micromonospora sediminicola]